MYVMEMPSKTRLAIVDNVQRLARRRNFVHTSGKYAGSININGLALSAKMNQKTLENLLSPDRHPGPPKLDTLEALASYFGLEVYHLTMPNLPIDLLEHTGDATKVTPGGFYLASVFARLPTDAQKEILGYAAYILDRLGDDTRRDKLRSLSEDLQ